MRNVELRKQKWAIKSIEQEVMSAKNQLLPQLDLTGIYRFVVLVMSGQVTANWLTVPTTWQQRV